MFKVIVKPLAELDALDAAKWYIGIRDDLGYEFLLVVDTKINVIQINL